MISNIKDNLCYIIICSGYQSRIFGNKEEKFVCLLSAHFWSALTYLASEGGTTQGLNIPYSVRKPIKVYYYIVRGMSLKKGEGMESMRLII